MRDFLRGFVVDPKLEKKLHTLADEARKTVGKANSTLGKVEDVQQLVVLAGLGLLVAGFMAGSMSAKATPQPESDPAEESSSSHEVH